MYGTTLRLNAAATLTTSQRRAAAAAWAEAEELVTNTASRFAHRYCQDTETVLADAQVVFAAWWRDTREADGSYGGNLRNTIWNELLDALRPETRRGKLRAPAAAADTVAAPAGTSYAWLAELGDDAALVVSLALDTPADIADTVAARGGAPRNLRRCLREHLAGMGWPASRISDTFNEIRGVLA